MTAVRVLKLIFLVLRPGYPTYLKKSKYYLAGGVAAAFECKITLKPEHILQTVRTAIKIRELMPRRTGTPMRS